MTPIVVDATALTASALGPGGPDDRAIADQADAGQRALAEILARRAELGFLDLPDDRSPGRACMDFARALDPAIDTVVVLGIGGSSLPGRALYSALAPPYDHLAPRSPGMPRRIFFADNIDPVAFGALVDRMDPARTLWNVVSKSGATVETLAQLLVVHARLGERMRVAVTTDPSEGPLLQLARDKQWPVFAIPRAISGRLSVLTPVALLPAALAGLDVAGLYDGARRMRERVIQTEKNPALLLASLLHHHHVLRGRSNLVAIAYADGLYDLIEWFRQLWAESLGKAGRGSTPIAARGAPEHHSQLQLWADGPDDKVYLAISPGERADLKIPRADGELAYLSGHGLGELLDITRDATLGSLVSRGRPVARIDLRRTAADAIGELVMLLEMTSLLAGPLYNVDPVGEPGVEDGKRRAFAALGRPGYEAIAVGLSKTPASDPKYVL